MESHPSKSSVTQTILVALVLFAILVTSVFVAYEWSKKRSATVVLPGGITYLGPSSTPTAITNQPSNQNQHQSPTTVTIPADAQWIEHKGSIYPYSFLYPSTLRIGVFPGDPFDSVTFFLENISTGNELFLRVENLETTPEAKQYAKLPKIEYVKNWWKQYNSWKGIGAIEPFTNSKGLKGFKVKYVDQNGQTPMQHVFLEVPNKPTYIIWMANKYFSDDIFNRIVDSVQWKQ